MFFPMLICIALALAGFTVGRWSKRHPSAPPIRLTSANQVKGNFPVPVKLFVPENDQSRFIVGHGETGQPIAFEGPICSQWHIAVNQITNQARLGLLLDQVEIAYLAAPKDAPPTPAEDAEEFAAAS